MASASAGLELPATSLIAPLLGRIAGSWREAPLPRALITRRRQGWQYDGQAGPGFVPVDSGDSGSNGWCHIVPSPACGGGTGWGHAKRKSVPAYPLPNPPPRAGEGATELVAGADPRNRR